MDDLIAAHAVYATRYRGRASQRFEDACVAASNASASADFPTAEEYVRSSRRWTASFGLIADTIIMRDAGRAIERARRLERSLVQLAEATRDHGNEPATSQPVPDDFGIPGSYEGLVRSEVTAYKHLIARHWYGGDVDFRVVWLITVFAIGCYIYFRPEPDAPLVAQLIMGVFLLTPLTILAAGMGAILSSSIPKSTPQPYPLVAAYKLRLERYELAKQKWDREQATLEEERRRGELNYWMSLDGWAFELEAAAVFERLGYEATVTSGSNDGGVDIYLRKDGRTTIVQCKHHVSRCPPAVVRELYGTLLHEKADAAFLLATGGFTAGAHEFAIDKPVRLITLDDLLSMRREGGQEMMASHEACAAGSLAVAGVATAPDLEWDSSNDSGEEEEEHESPAIARSFRVPGARFVLSATWPIPELQNRLRMSPTGSFLVTGRSSGTQKIWKTDGTPVGELDGGDLEIVSDGSLLVTRSYPHSPGDACRVWDVHGKELFRIGASFPSYTAAKRCFVTEEEKTVMLRDTTGAVVLELEGRRAIVSPSGRHMIALGKAFCPVVYRLKKEGYGVSRRTEVWGTEGWPCYFALRDTAFITRSDKEAHLWNLKGERLASFHGQVRDMSPDGSFLTSLTKDGVAIYRMSGELIGHSWMTPRFSRGDSLVVTRNGGRVRLRDCATFESLAELADADYEFHAQSVCIDESNAVVRRGNQLFVLSNDGSATELLRLDWGEHYECAASDDGSVFAVTTSSSVSVFHRIGT